MSTANFIVIQDGTSTISAFLPPFPDYPYLVEFPEFDLPDADLGLRPVLTFEVISSAGDPTLTIALNNQCEQTR